MKSKKPLFITLIISIAIIGIIAVVLFVKNKPIEEKPKRKTIIEEPKEEQTPNEEIELDNNLP